jgi:hypothetical protein
LDQTFALKSVGRFGRGRLERALRSSFKRDSFIFALLKNSSRQSGVHTSFPTLTREKAESLIISVIFFQTCEDCEAVRALGA